MIGIKSGSFLLITFLTMLYLAGLGWIYVDFPQNWWHAVDPFSWFLGVGTIVFYGALLGGLASLVFWVPFRLCNKTAPSLTQKHLLFLIPVVASLPIAFWGAYCWQQPLRGIYPAFGEILDYWYLNVLVNLFATTLFYQLMIGFYILISNNWKGEKLHAYCYLGSGLMFSTVVLFLSRFFALRPMM